MQLTVRLFFKRLVDNRSQGSPHQRANNKDPEACKRSGIACSGSDDRRADASGGVNGSARQTDAEDLHTNKCQTVRQYLLLTAVISPLQSCWLLNPLSDSKRQAQPRLLLHPH